MNARFANSRSARIFTGVAAAAAVALLARRVQALSLSGALAAIPIGGAVFAGAGLRGSAILLTYVASSNLLGRLAPDGANLQRRGNERDAVQVFANGGIPALLSLAILLPGNKRNRMLWAAFGGAVAAATADTWATEIGSRAGQLPRSVLDWQPVARGASGGVTPVGLAASVAGAGVIAALAAIAPKSRQAQSPVPPYSASILLGGIVGSLVDSVLGASVQQIRFCDVCLRETEFLVHTCGTPTRHRRGQHWCNNDVVNALAVASGAAAAAAICAGRGATLYGPPRGRIMNDAHTVDATRGSLGLTT